MHHVLIVLAGRSSARLGGADKAMVDLDGITLLDRVLSATDAEAVVVGPERPTSRPVLWCEEEPVGGGPVAAFAAGLAVAPPSEMVLLLGSDLPFIGGAVAPLLSTSADVAVLVDADGRANYLASAWRRHVVEAALARVGDPTGLPMRRLVDGLTVEEVRDTGGWGFDCDTWDAVEEARERGATSTP
ncbi:MAG: molybdenum cofactor guanylyltransferase [Marmoricola sp.]